MPEGYVTDLSRGYVPITLIGVIIATALATGMWMQRNQQSVENLEKSLQAFRSEIGDMKTQMGQLSNQVVAMNLALAQGPKMPENVAYKADLLRLCINNRELKCPEW